MTHSTDTVMASTDARRRLRVLIVDDHPDNLHMYALYLRSRGYEAFEARNGAEALDSLAAVEPDLIVMDIGMPVMDGWEAIQQIRRDPRTKKTPIIVLTAHVFSGEAQRARNLGATSYLTKPCLPEDLGYEIGRVLGVDAPGARPGHRSPRGKRRPRS
jgi:two-component system cell cycle response regulator DivK